MAIITFKQVFIVSQEGVPSSSSDISEWSELNSQAGVKILSRGNAGFHIYQLDIINKEIVDIL